jgi:glutamate 5-kinase
MTKPERIVVKVGTSTVTGGGDRPDPIRLAALATQLAELRRRGHDVVLVSSGAIASGRAALGATVARDVPVKQMHAAVGQPRLHALWQAQLAPHGLIAGQVLLTRSDVENRRRYLNARNALLAMLAHGVLPIVNENDTVATEEIRLGDNDNLSALVASLVDADRLVLLTDQPGLFDRDPRTDAGARLIAEVPAGELPPGLAAVAGASAGGVGTGGMATKLAAATLAQRGGITAHIAAGGEPEVLLRLLGGESLGTRFPAAGVRLASRKRYILAGGHARGSLALDAGAVGALRQGKSVLPVGVREVSGRFERGDPVRLLGPDGAELGRGVAAYSADDMRRIAGRRSEDIEPILGFRFGDALVHRNDLVLRS